MEVIVRIIKANPWSGVVKWPTTFDYVASYWTRSGNLYTGLTEEDARRMEKELGYAEGQLSPRSPFWDTFAVKIGRKDVILNTDRPEDELKYLFLKNHKRVANGLNRITPGTDYVMINGDAEAEEQNRLNKVKREAYREMDKMSPEEMRKCLRLYAIKSDTMSNDVAEAKLAEVIEQNPKRFLDKWVNNPNKEMNFVIEEALAKNIIRKNRTNYYYGTDIIGNGLEDVIAYLKNKANQEILLSIKSEIQSK